MAFAGDLTGAEKREPESGSRGLRQARIWLAGVEAGVPGKRLVRVLGQSERGAMECARQNLTT